MRVALINPTWSFDGSIYFGCRAPHLPLELGCGKALLERAGHTAGIIDGHLQGLSDAELRARVAAFAPDLTVVTTAPTYLFWRCAPPELRVPQRLLRALAGVAGRTVAVGPHGSTTPRAALAKLGVDVVVMGECEEIVLRLADAGGDPARLPSVAFTDHDGTVRVQGGPWASRFTDLPALDWSDAWIARQGHHHHRFDAAPQAPGADHLVARDGGEMARHLRAVLSDPGLAAALRANGLAAIRDRNTCRHRVAQLLALCTSLGAGLGAADPAPRTAPAAAHGGP